MAIALKGECLAGGNVNTFVLSNGLKVIHRQVASNPLVTAEVFFKTGSIAEPESEAGLANFTQSLLMQGTEKRSSEDLARAIEDIGANVSSDTGNDYSNLGISVIDSKFDKAMELLSEIVTQPSFPEQEIKKEKMNILATIRSRKDSISLTASDIFIKSFYGNHPYSWPEIGREQTVSEFKREDLVRWHRERYTADNMILVIVGNISMSEAQKTALKFFSSVAGRSKPVKIMQAISPEKKAILEKNPKFKQAFLIVGFPAPQLGGEGYAELKMINAILGSRMTGRLFIELREKLSLAYEVNSGYPTRMELGRFFIYIGLEKKNIPLAKKRMFELLDDLKNVPVRDKELQDTRNYLKGTYLLDHQTINRQAWYMGWWEVLGKGYDYDQKYLDELLAVTPEQIQKAAKKFFTDTFVSVELVPE